MNKQSSNPPNFDSLNVIEQRLTEIETESNQWLLRKKLLVKQTSTVKGTFTPEEKVQLFQIYSKVESMLSINSIRVSYMPLRHLEKQLLLLD